MELPGLQQFPPGSKSSTKALRLSVRMVWNCRGIASWNSVSGRQREWLLPSRRLSLFVQAHLWIGKHCQGGQSSGSRPLGARVTSATATALATSNAREPWRSMNGPMNGATKAPQRRAERHRPGDAGARPAELAGHRHDEDRERRHRRGLAHDAGAHRTADDDPAVEERQAPGEGPDHRIGGNDAARGDGKTRRVCFSHALKLRGGQQCLCTMSAAFPSVSHCGPVERCWHRAGGVRSPARAGSSVVPR